jgi:hypothetical protein
MAKLDSVTIADPAAKIASAAVIEMRAFNMTLLLRTSFRNSDQHATPAARSDCSSFEKGDNRQKFQTETLPSSH